MNPTTLNLQTAPKAKLALCIRTPDLVQYHVGMSLVPLDQIFYEQDSFLVDRAICETDEDTVQLLPYVVVVNNNFDVFHYSRGKGGAEERLKANTSIGLGGHVDEAVQDNGESMEFDDSLYDLLQREAKRELQEEIGIEVQGELNFTHLIIDRTNPVGRVHLGLLAVYHLPEDTKIKLEEHAIVDGQFMPLHKFADPVVYNKPENWSKLAIMHYANE